MKILSYYKNRKVTEKLLTIDAHSRKGEYGVILRSKIEKTEKINEYLKASGK